ncbi:MAG TPA: VWA domain-containing protein [Terriglobales bacterium]|nr:VWA domain-containing protein [Terriglobales bacterium]
MAKRLTTAFALLIILAGAACAQMPAAPPDKPPLLSEPAASVTSETPPHFQSSVTEVNQVFTVLDHKGHPIPDLQRTDFIIKDAGRSVDNVVAFRQQAETPLNIAVAIDLSGSVSPRVGYEVEVTTKFLKRVLRPGDTGKIIGFNYVSYLIENLAEARNKLLAIHRQEPGAGTAFYDAVIFACDRLSAAPATNRRDVLVVISDGVDNGSHSSFQDALEAAVRRGVIVLALYTGYDGSTRELRTLTDMTGGQFFSAITVRGVLNALARAEQAIRGQYLLAYRPPAFTPDGSFRLVSIRPVGKGLRVRCRKGYYADPPVGPRGK